MSDAEAGSVHEMRVVMTSADFDQDLVFYRDVLGLEQLADYSSGNARAVLLGAGVATIELADERHAAAVDELEVGRRVAGSIRIAFEVADAAASTTAAVDAGATLIAAPVTTPWDSVNSRLTAPGGQQLTLFNER